MRLLLIHSTQNIRKWTVPFSIYPSCRKRKYKRTSSVLPIKSNKEGRQPKIILKIELNIKSELKN